MYLAFASLLVSVLSSQEQPLPEGKGKDVALTVCTSCHPPLFAGMRGDRRFWESMIDRMIVRGALISDEQTQILIDYLMKFFGPDVNINKVEAAALQNELGITSTEAEAIVRYRHEHGGLKDWADVEKIEGLDARKLDPLRKRIVFQDR
jgi:competence protein ComEA